LAVAAPVLASLRRAMALNGFMAALRRSEILAMRISDVTSPIVAAWPCRCSNSKTDQQDGARTIAISANREEPEFCPLAAYHPWMD
jgi:hypothetical protein